MHGNPPQILYFYCMSNIRRQGVISSVLIFIGFAIGFLNNIFFTREGYFTVEQYGLTRSFFDFSQVIVSFSILGVSAGIYKFYPYYKANLPDKENDLLSWALLVSCIGFILFFTCGYLFESFFVRKFSEKSPLLVSYYYWIYIFAFSLLIFTVLENYSGSLKQTIVTNFLKETVLRLLTTLLILLFILQLINYDVFIKLFAFLYMAVVVVLLICLKNKNQLHFTFKPSRVTKKFRKKMIVYCGFIFFAIVMSSLSGTIDSIIISQALGQDFLGVFSFASYITNVMQVPQRSVMAISLPSLAEGWREKNYPLIERIYKRSSINLLLAALFIFGNIWLNFDALIEIFKLDPRYLDGKMVVFILACKLIVDMGTGLNSQIIITSRYWRFEILTGIILLFLIAPLNIFLVKTMGLGITGSAIANLTAYSVYNLIRIIFLWKKYKMQPFSINTIWALLLAAACYFLVFYSLPVIQGLKGLVLRSAVFSLLFVSATWYFKLTPDFEPVLNTLKKRLGIKREA